MAGVSDMAITTGRGRPVTGLGQREANALSDTKYKYRCVMRIKCNVPGKVRVTHAKYNGATPLYLETVMLKG
jgi:hypothetical protein